MSNYQFVVNNGIAKGVLPDGTSFLIDEDMIEKVNTQAFHLNHKGYIYSLKPKGQSNIRLHWFIFGLTSKPDYIIDHINRDKTDCRRCNLRITDNQHNSCNRSLNANNRSGYRGVCYSNSFKKYLAQIGYKRKRILLWKSDSAIECAYAFNIAAKYLYEDYVGFLNEIDFISKDIKTMVLEKCKKAINKEDSRWLKTEQPEVVQEQQAEENQPSKKCLMLLQA